MGRSWCWLMAAFATGALASRYDLDFSLGQCDLATRSCSPVIAYTEGQMYAKGNGPFSFVLSNDDDAWISLDASLSTESGSAYQFGAFSCTREFYNEHVDSKNQFCGPCGPPPINNQFCGTVLDIEGADTQRWDVPARFMGPKRL